MKIQLFLALLVGQTVAAPLGGSIDGSLSASPGDATGALKIKASGPSEPTIEEKVKGFEAVLYLFAPENWVSSWNDVSNEGKQCFLSRAADPANAEIYQSEDSTKMKDDLKAKCSSSYDQLIKFANQTEDTMKALPESFLSISKAWGQQMQTLGNQFKSAAKSTADSAKSTADAAKTGADAAGNQIANAASSGAAKASDAWKGAVSQFAKPTSEYLAKLSAMSQEDRQKLSAAFPKLEPFFSGDHAVEFLNEVTNIYKTIGSGDFNPTSLQPEAQKLATTWSTLWDQYKTKNTDGLKKAGDIWKKDLIQAGDAFSASLASQVNGNWNKMALAGSPAVGTLPGSPSAVPVAGLPSGISGSATGGVDASVPGASASSSFVSKLSEKNPDLADTIKKRVEEGKEKLNETKEKVKEGLNKAGESAKTGFENAKETLNKAGENAKEGLKDARENLKEAFNDFKENAKDFKEKHLNFPSESASGTVNANGNDASAGFRLNN